MLPDVRATSGWHQGHFFPALYCVYVSHPYPRGAHGAGHTPRMGEVFGWGGEGWGGTRHRVITVMVIPKAPGLALIGLLSSGDGLVRVLTAPWQHCAARDTHASRVSALRTCEMPAGQEVLLWHLICPCILGALGSRCGCSCRVYECLWLPVSTVSSSLHFSLVFLHQPPLAVPKGW